MSKPKRPAAVTLLAILEVSLATLALLVVAAARFELIQHIRWSVESLTIILLILAGFELALAYGFWTGKAWAWTVGLLFAILGTAISIFALYVRPTPGEVIYLVIDLTVIYFLMQPRVHQYFKHNGTPGK
ncbi:MAG: hypothetical protein ABSF09_00365 [Candidatus Bathyarchaeia archaeon]|jgi:uncharacterized membrane protein (DUF2068 family)